MRHALSRINEDLRTGRMRGSDDLLERVSYAQNVGCVDHTDEFCALQGVVEGIHVEREMLGDGHIAKFNASLLGQHLPGNNVGVVLHFRQNDGVAFLEVCTAPRMSDEVDGLGGSAGDDDLVRIEALLEFAAAGLVPLGGFTCEGVNRTVDIGVGLRVVMVHRIEHDLRLLRGGSVVEVHERVAVDLSLQNGKLVSQRHELTS